MKTKENSLADKILLAIKDMADIFYDGLPKDKKLHEYFKGCNRHSIVCTLNRLKKEGLVEEIKVDNKEIYRLTTKGKIKIFYSFVNHKPKWDGKWRMVIFDIPEQKKKLREIFRSRLKDLGFERMQNSVWVTPNDVQGVIKLLTEAFELDNYVHFVIADQISGEKKLIEKFKLKF